MKFSVMIEPEARLDLTAAFEWYQGQLDGLGGEFLISVEAAFSLLERTPDVYQAIHRDIRRAPLKRFPFALFYVARGTKVHILAVFHARRDPQGWKERISAFLAKKG